VTVLENGFENVLAKIAHTKGNPIRSKYRKTTPSSVSAVFEKDYSYTKLKVKQK
jgi:hypothetical protein